MKNFLDGFFAFFSKLKVLYQILIVIFLMVAFLVAQGIMANNNITKIQQRTQAIVSKGINGLDSVMTYQLNIERLKNVYHEALTGKTQGGIAFSMAKLNLDFDCFDFDATTKRAIRDSFTMLDKLVNQPVSAQNWKRIEKIIAANNLYVNEMNQQAHYQVSAAVELGTQFANKSKFYTTLFVVLSLTLSFILALITTASISKPLHVIVEVANDLAKGNISKNIEVKGCLEVVQVVDGLQQAIFSLRKLVLGIREHSGMLLAAGQELNLAAHETGRSAVEVSRAMQELSKAATEETNEIVNTVANVNELSNLVRKVSGDTVQIAISSGKIADSSQNGQQVAIDAAQEISDLYFSINEVAALIGELNYKSNEITKITALIEGIAEQTSLLALNAAIEAARAGDEGRGFSVVASETGKLADQSKQAAKTIAQVLVDMQQRSDKAVRVIEAGLGKVSTGKELTTKAKETFEEIFGRLDQTLTQIQQVASAAHLMAEKNESVSAAIANISAISEETMSSTEEISATSEQQSASVEEVSALAGNLFDMANRLKDSVVVFKI
jgi:methyl-accepting chemotaxis protein